MRNDQIYDLSGNGVISNVTARNTVLRNTYWLLAASMAPTVFGAWLGVSAGFSLLSATSPGMSMLLFMGIAFGFMFAIERFKNSGTGAIFATMATIATVSKRDFSGLGQWLFMGAIVLIIASVANIWLKLPAL